MKQVLPKVELYVTSLIFLFALLLLNKIPVCWGDDCGFIGWDALFAWDQKVLLLSVLMIAVGLVCQARFRYRFVKGATQVPMKVTKVQNIHYETLAFLATYIIPLASFDLDFGLEPCRHFVVFLAMLLLIGAIYIRTNLYYTNPTLALFGYRVYKVSTLTQTDIIVVSIGKLQVDDYIKVRNIEDDVYFAKRHQ